MVGHTCIGHVTDIQWGPIMKKSIKGNIVAFTFDGLPDYNFDTTKVSSANRDYAVPFGFAHRLGDAAAIARKDKDGNVITVTEAMRREAVVSLATHYTGDGDKLLPSMEWEVRGMTKAAPRNPVWEAIAAKRGVDYEIVAAEYAQRALDDLAALG